MYNNNIPIIFNSPKNSEYIDIYFIHDVHYGSVQFNPNKYNNLKNKILSDPNTYVMFIGDLIENAIPNSKSSVWEQNKHPQEQLEWATQQLTDLSDKTIAIVSGNHCSNRTTKTCGIHPLYEACLIAGIGDKYRDIYAITDIGVGVNKRNRGKQVHYFGQIMHKAKEFKNYCSADYTDGIDFFAYGHDHEPKDRPRAKLVYDPHNKTISKRNVETIDCGSFLDYGGYGASSAYRPQSDKMYSLRLFGNNKQIQTTGFYV